MSMERSAIACVLWGAHTVPSVKRVCVECKQDVAISLPASTRDLDPLCIPCAHKSFQEHKEAQVGSTLPEVREALKKQGWSDEEIDARSKHLAKLILGERDE